ncbi:hypothetical protein HZA57_07485 [Candidatus Poribacteria bacterium]|nr:hypothetical protein [Candidatus Poribacteria bacterium]
MQLRLYLDTSVISACGDATWPSRQLESKAFFARRGDFYLFTSDLARTEIRRTRDLTRREEMLVLLDTIERIPVSGEMELLAREYVDAGIFTFNQMEDGIHVAAAVLANAAVLVSWNFRHLVNRRRRGMVLAVNAALGYPQLDIVTPPEV